MNNYKVLMKDRDGVRVKLFISAKSVRDATSEAQELRKDCTVEHVRLELKK